VEGEVVMFKELMCIENGIDKEDDERGREEGQKEGAKEGGREAEGMKRTGRKEMFRKNITKWPMKKTLFRLFNITNKAYKFVDILSGLERTPLDPLFTLIQDPLLSCIISPHTSMVATCGYSNTPSTLV
jgi:hypothetical protein